MVHVNSNNFYVLRGKAINSIDWESTGGYWPMYLNLENNDAVFGGNISAAKDVIAFSGSDRRLKENIRDITGALEVVNHVGGKLFDWTDEHIESRGGEDGYHNRKEDFGVVAQDVQEVFPLGVRTRPDGTLAVDYEKLCAVAFAAIKELNEKVSQLEQRINK
jgi:hypothetical protein